MTILLLVLGGLALIPIGYFITWIADVGWRWTLNLGLRLNKNGPSKGPQGIAQVPNADLPSINPKEEESLPTFSKEFMEEFGNWMEKAQASTHDRDTEAPRHVRTQVTKPDQQ